MGIEQKQINVALACVIHERKILLTKRQEKAQPDIDSMWELPGGKVEFSESPLMTAIREVKEETGYEIVDPIGLPFPYTVVRQYENYILHVIIFCFECKLVGGKLGNFRQTENKIAAVQWFDIENINFMDIAAGSREFISWVLDKRGFNLKNLGDNAKCFQSYMFFERSTPSNDGKQFYFISANYVPSGSTEFKYKVLLGSVVNKLNYEILSNLCGSDIENEFFFKDEPSMQEKIIKLTGERINHGYKIISCTLNIPVRGWLQQLSI